MSYFKFLDNRYRNLGLDNQITFSLAKDGEQQATHLWVLTIRRFYKWVNFVAMPVKYLVSLFKPEQDYTTRVEEMKAYTTKVLQAAKEAQDSGASLPPDPADLLKPDSVKPGENN